RWVIGGSFARPWRLAIYAPHVKRLSVYGENHKWFQMENWAMLYDHFKPGILPNLQSLRLKTSVLIDAQDQLLWATFFASKSLTELQVLSADNGFEYLSQSLSYEMTSVLLKVLAERCPQLHTLSIHPDPSPISRPDYHGSELCLMQFIEDQPYDKYLKSFSHLRELWTTTAILGTSAA
ncbi:hypothetical protein FS749_014089, partial [Ceratobasidium sp. UAMH 11750]